jgi:hypothetical protein
VKLENMMNRIYLSIYLRLVSEIKIMTKMNEEEKLFKRATKWANELKSFLERAKDNTITELNEYERFLRLVKEQGSNSSSDDFMGTKECPATIKTYQVYDSRACDNCGVINKIFSKDIPNLLLVYKSFANGITHPFRGLYETYGLIYQKIDEVQGKTLNLFGFEPIDPKEKRPNVPNDVKTYYETLIKSGLEQCVNCQCELSLESKKLEC